MQQDLALERVDVGREVELGGDDLAARALGPVEGGDQRVLVDGGGAGGDDFVRLRADERSHHRAEPLAQREPARFGRHPAVDTERLPLIERGQDGGFGVLRTSGRGSCRPCRSCRGGGGSARGNRPGGRRHRDRGQLRGLRKRASKQLLLGFTSGWSHGEIFAKEYTAEAMAGTRMSVADRPELPVDMGRSWKGMKSSVQGDPCEWSHHVRLTRR